MSISPLNLEQLRLSKTPLEAAQALHKLGLTPVPILRGADRRPACKWGSESGYNPAYADLPGLFLPIRNVGFFGALVDVDLDQPAAAAAAAILLADFPSVGRASNPESHRLVQLSEGAVKTVAFKAPATLKGDPLWSGPHGLTIVEIKGPGSLITVPPSVHPSGEPYVWDNRLPLRTISEAELFLRVGAIALTCVFDRYYPSEGGRHTACVDFTGALVKDFKIPADEADQLVKVIAERNRDEDWRNRGVRSPAMLSP
jgi:hypothetical protein